MHDVIKKYILVFISDLGVGRLLLPTGVYLSIRTKK